MISVSILLLTLDFKNANDIYNFCCDKGGILPCAILYLAHTRPPPIKRKHSVSVPKYISNYLIFKGTARNPIEQMGGDLCNHVPICGLSHWAPRDRTSVLALVAWTTREDGRLGDS